MFVGEVVELVVGLRSMIFALARICARRPMISEADMFDVLGIGECRDLLCGERRGIGRLVQFSKCVLLSCRSSMKKLRQHW